MKSHDIAKAMTELAGTLKSAPNTDISKLTLSKAASVERLGSNQIAISLDILVSLASIDKSEWLNFANEMNLPLKFRPRDGSRDILGKIFKYLEENKEAREKIKAKVRQKSLEGSASVMKALSLLIPEK
jgi:hypothetical protein